MSHPAILLYIVFAILIYNMNIRSWCAVHIVNTVHIIQYTAVWRSYLSACVIKGTCMRLFYQVFHESVEGKQSTKPFTMPKFELFADLINNVHWAYSLQSHINLWYILFYHLNQNTFKHPEICVTNYSTRRNKSVRKIFVNSKLLSKIYQLKYNAIHLTNSIPYLEPGSLKIKR